MEKYRIENLQKVKDAIIAALSDEPVEFLDENEEEIYKTMNYLLACIEEDS